MYAVINHLHLTKPIDDLPDPIDRELKPMISALPGFRGFSIVKEAEDRATVLIFWETQADAVNGGNTVEPIWFHEYVAPYLASEQQRTLGEIVANVMV